MVYTDDPLYDFEQYDSEQTCLLENRPICYGCGEHIREEYAYEIDGLLYCEDCIEQSKVYFE